MVLAGGVRGPDAAVAATPRGHVPGTLRRALRAGTAPAGGA
ncbi:hypothetical protein SHJG_0658 [Streptomyces hygroscopicus subsp. jinggangensis 5008]|nr:hypothetical protein SHJG_0658 [Streptomyces hygroscopicus subsp. jinggangensis 5008]AGF60157.1 hypothetical protein SHJGH_0491 [Streptomyces hygroscopicus subsp. jinggangensis TL01]